MRRTGGCWEDAAKAWKASPCPPVRGFLVGEAKRFSVSGRDPVPVRRAAVGEMASPVRVIISIADTGSWGSSLIAKRAVVSWKSLVTSFMDLQEWKGES